MQNFAALWQFTMEMVRHEEEYGIEARIEIVFRQSGKNLFERFLGSPNSIIYGIFDSHEDPARSTEYTRVSLSKDGIRVYVRACVCIESRGKAWVKARAKMYRARIFANIELPPVNSIPSPASWNLKRSRLNALYYLLKFASIIPHLTGWNTRNTKMNEIPN